MTTRKTKPTLKNSFTGSEKGGPKKECLFVRDVSAQGLKSA